MKLLFNRRSTCLPVTLKCKQHWLGKYDWKVQKLANVCTCMCNYFKTQYNKFKEFVEVYLSLVILTRALIWAWTDRLCLQRFANKPRQGMVKSDWGCCLWSNRQQSSYTVQSDNTVCYDKDTTNHSDSLHSPSSFCLQRRLHVLTTSNYPL